MITITLYLHHCHTHTLIIIITHVHTHTLAVRIYHRRGARRWKKVRRINGHAFVAKRFQMAFCDKCEDRIWGLGRQGYRCESCKMTVHKRCCYYLKQDEICKGHLVCVSFFLSLSLFSLLFLLLFWSSSLPFLLNYPSLCFMTDAYDLTSIYSQPLKPAVEGESIAPKPKKGTDYYSGYLQQKVWQSNDAYMCMYI